jgi:hypothetical protein
MMATQPENSKEREYSDVEIRKSNITVDPVLDLQQRFGAERALVRKLDSRLLPMVVLIFIMNNIGCSSSFFLNRL